ncbi:MAG: amidohydrolase family protein [Candidatus Hodarchaeales archaeon]|jgi:predicted TIM-barrel fold metal-dependent hydrolase
MAFDSRKIDVHLHSDYYSPTDEIGKVFPNLSRLTPANSPDDLLHKTVSAMDDNNIVKGLVSGSPESVDRWKKSYPDRFITSIGIGGDPIEPSIDFLRKRHEKGKLSWLGEIGTQYQGISPNDPKLDAYFALAVELDIPVLIHTCGGGGPEPNFRLKAGNPLLLEDVLKKYPTLRIWLENAGYPFINEMKALMGHFPNVYGDLSTVCWIFARRAFHDHLQALIRADFGKRLMFGTDSMIWPESIGIAIESIETATFLSEEQKLDIYYNNAVDFLRL